MSEHLTTADVGLRHASSETDFYPRRLRYWVSVLCLAAADAAAFALAKALFGTGLSLPAFVLYRGTVVVQTPVDVFLILAALFILLRYVSGDYSRRQLFWDSARATTVTLLVAFVPYLLFSLVDGTGFSPVPLFGGWVFLLVAVPALRQAARMAMSLAGIWRLPTALIASGSRAGDVFTALSGTLSLGLDIRWLVVEGYDREPPAALDHLKHIFLADPGDITEKLISNNCDQAIVATDDMQSPAFANLVQRLMEAGIAVAFIPSFRRLPLVGVTTSYFFGHDILLFQVRNNLRRFPHRFVKRTFDIFGSLALLILLSPLFAFIAIAIKYYDDGPVIYSQKRTGRRGKPFPCLKFRTMTVDADSRLYRWRQENPELYEQYLKTYKLRDDPRITPPGMWLRRTSLDELPQLVNVLRGEMSLVGPRPVLERELIQHYGPAAQLYKRVRPGLTGLWQVSGRSDTTYEERVIYDEWYILNWTFWYDIVIMLQTAWIVVSGKGAY